MVRRAIVRASRAVDRTARVFMQVALAVIVLLVLAEVVSRDVVGRSLTWMEEVAVTYIGTWFVFIGASHALRIGMLVSLEFVVERLGDRARRVIGAVSVMSMLTFLGVVIFYGTRLSIAALGQPSPALQLPMGLAYFGVVVGCGFMVLHLLAGLFEPPVRVAGK